MNQTIVEIATKLILKFMILSVSSVLLWFQQPSNLSLQIFAVGSQSMTPTLNRGDLLMTLKQSQYQLGDAITYYTQSSNFRTHRIVAKWPSQHETVYQTQGDTNPTTDLEVIHQNQVIGKVFFALPIIGYPAVWFNAWSSIK